MRQIARVPQLQRAESALFLTRRAALLGLRRAGGRLLYRGAADVVWRQNPLSRFVLLLSLALLLPAQALAQGEVKSKHGDWDLRCDTPAGAQNQQCVIMQFVTAQDRENVGLSVVVMKTADKKARILRVLAPLGVLLPRGLGLRIDDTDMGTTGFIRCLPNGCVSEVLMDDQLIDKLRNGKQAMFVIFQTPEEGIGVPISLAGFGEGFDALP
jgi:invasion protein IalB